uniref:Uncharacterized protein n=1 Tax=Panagrolaimus davidi TaxID=227884 RepID=A0A914QSU7_9BILA
MHAFTLQFIFRLAALYETKYWFHKFSQLKFIWLFMFPFLALLLALITLGFALDQPEGESFRQTLSSEYPFFNELFERHGFAMGYHPTFSGGIKIMFGSIVLMSYIYPILIIVVYIFYFRQLNFVKHKLNQKNKCLHDMLLRALIAQSIILFIFILFPFEIVGCALVFPYKQASFAASCAPIFVMAHTFIDILCQFYYIKPYKNWVIKTFKIIKNRQISHATTMEVTNVTMAFTSIPKIRITMQK